MAKGIKRQVMAALNAASKGINIQSRDGGVYAKGLASEGYKGGYRDALNDVLLALNGVEPHRWNYWRKIAQEITAKRAGVRFP